MSSFEPPRELLEPTRSDALRCSRARSVLVHLRIGSTDSAWRPPAWHGAAIRLACVLLDGGEESEVRNAWTALITGGATYWYLSRVLASLEEV